jgi:hypothetical protein
MLAHDGKALTMDADRFDSLSRSLPFRSRRGAVRAISILGALGVLDRLGATAAEKKKGGKKKGGRSKRDCESCPTCESCLTCERCFISRAPTCVGGCPDGCFCFHGPGGDAPFCASSGSGGGHCDDASCTSHGDCMGTEKPYCMFALSSAESEGQIVPVDCQGKGICVSFSPCGA